MSVSANGERISPLRTGTLTETDSGASAAATGAGDGSYPGGVGGSAATSTVDQGISEGSTSSSGPTDAETTNRGPIDLDDLKHIFSRTLPDILFLIRLGSESLVAIFSGLLALHGIANGLRKLH